jgi:hypothetical protein
MRTGILQYVRILRVSLPIKIAASAVRSHDYEIAAPGFRSVDDRLVGMFMLDMNRRARHAGRLRHLRGGAQDRLGQREHPHPVRGSGVLIICVSVVNT